MVLPFIAAAATGFLEEGVKQKDLYDKRQFELEKQRQASKLNMQEQKQLYDYKMQLEKAKLDAEKAGFNKELFGVSYNTEGMTTYAQKSMAAIAAISSDPTSAKAYLKNLKNTNSQAYEQQKARFASDYQTAQIEYAKQSGKQMGVAGIPDMLRIYSGLGEFLSDPELADIGNFLKNQNASFKYAQKQQEREELRRRIEQKLGPEISANAKELVMTQFDSGKNISPDSVDDLVTSATEPLKRPLPPPNQTPDQRYQNKVLADYYNKRRLTLEDKTALGLNWRIGYTVGKLQRRTSDGYVRIRQQIGAAYDQSFALHKTKLPEVAQGQFAFADRNLQIQNYHKEMMKNPAIAKQISSKQSLYQTLKDINLPLIQITDILQDPRVGVGLQGFIQNIVNGTRGQVQSMRAALERTVRPTGMSDAAFKVFANGRKLLSQELNSSYKNLEDLAATEGELSVEEKLALVESISNLSAFLLARYAQKDDNKISNDDVQQTKGQLGLNKLLTSPKQAKAKLGYFIDESQELMMQLEGYSVERNPRTSMAAFQHAQLWEQMTSASRGINTNTGRTVLTPREAAQAEREVEQSTDVGITFGQLPRQMNVEMDREILLGPQGLLDKVETALGLPKGEQRYAVRPGGNPLVHEEILSKKLRQDFINQKAQGRNTFYVVAVKTEGEDKFAVLNLSIDPRDRKFYPTFVAAGNTMEELYRKFGLRYSVGNNTTDAASSTPAASSEEPKNAISSRIKSRKAKVPGLAFPGVTNP